MKCPDCKVEMEKGSLIAHGQLWVLGIPDVAKFLFGGSKRTYAWRCPKCKKIILQTG